MIGRALVPERRATLRQPPEWMVDTLTGGVTPSGQTVTATSALGHVDVYACVRVVATSASSLPLVTYRTTSSGRQRASGSLVDDLLQRPAPGVTQSAFIATGMTHLELWGNAYIGKYRTRGQIVQLGYIDPRLVHVCRENGEPVYRVQGIDGDLTRRDILHVRYLSLDGLRGLSPIGQARTAIGLGMSLEEHAARFFANGAHPSGVVQVPGTMDDDDVETFVRTWDAMHRGTANAHRPAILTGGAQWAPIGMPPEDAQFVEQRRLSTTQVCRIFGVHPWMIFADAGDSLTYSNVEQQQLAFSMHSLRPRLVAFEQALRNDDDLYAPDGDLYPEFLIDALLRADTATRADVYSTALAGRPYMTANEVRRLENLPAVAGGDDLDQHAPDAPSTDAPADPTPDAPRSLRSLDAAESRAADVAPVVNVTVEPTIIVPAQDAPTVNVTLPDQPAPVVNVAAPTVNVSLPDQPAPNVTVNVPKGPAPVVNVAAPSSDRTVVVQRDVAGRLSTLKIKEDA